MVEMRTFFALTLSLCFVLTTRAQVSFEDGIKSHLDKLSKESLPGIAVLVARDGKIAFQSGFGLADVQAKTQVTPDTKFRIGSITKQFTAAAILRLAEDGKLTLDDPVEKHLPGFPRGRDITLRHLLTHTSGIHSYTSKPGFLDRVVQPIAPADLIAWFRDDPADFAPGAGFLYNNSAYFLAGEIVAKVSGQSLDAYLRTTFFEPLGMKDTGIFVNSNPPAGIAKGYSVKDGKAEAALDWDMSWAGGAGALFSTVGDLYRWNEALFGGRILKPESFKQMTTPVALPPGVDGMSYGFGVAITPVHRLPAIGHGGGLNGWASDLVRFTDQNCTIVVLGNALPPVPGRSPAEISRKIAAKFLETEIKALPTLQPDRTVDAKSYGAYAGRYQYPGGAILAVAVEGEHLYAQLTGQPRFEIFPRAADAFFWKVTDAEVVFLRDEKGAVTSARHTQNGNKFKAPRLPDSELKLKDTELDAILGRYQYGPAAILTVTRDGDQVFAQLSGQPKFPIYPKSALEWEWRVVPATVTFSADTAGQIISAQHSQNGRTFSAPKLK